MIIRAKTHYTEKLLKDFAKFNFFVRPKFLMAFLIIIEVAIAVVFTIFGIKDFDWATTITGVFCFLISPLMIISSYYSAVKSLRNTLSGTIVEYEFDKTELRTKATNTGVNGEGTISYKTIYKIYETDEYFYILIFWQFHIWNADSTKHDIPHRVPTLLLTVFHTPRLTDPFLLK